MCVNSVVLFIDKIIVLCNVIVDCNAMFTYVERLEDHIGISVLLCALICIILYTCLFRYLLLHRMFYMHALSHFTK